jgi:hypothetical protein
MNTFMARVAISWTSVHLLNSISVGSCGLYTAKEVDIVLAHCVGGGLAVPCHQLIKYVTNGHRRVPTCCWWCCWWCNFENMVNVLVECVVARSVYVFPCFDVVLDHGKYCIHC